ncbi:MAG: glycoside hydrolase family 3 protein [Spirochaetaceae bacterium]|jgi:beta-N-acetylhexosaminidase|nr:glycoside hydrolase family 3 protein [Spirochaetaceae bacterium]
MQSLPKLWYAVIMPRDKMRLFLVALLFCSVRLFPVSFNDEGSPEEIAARLLEAMSDEQVLAQTFMLGWVGAAPSPLILEWIQKRNIGGVKIFGWNTADTTLLAQTVGELQTNALKGDFDIPLFVATDQEGGWIRHVKGATSETPGNMAIGASGYPQDAYWSGYYIGRELALLGINMNFAPTVDLYTNRDSVLIGPRAFGVNPVHAGILGAAFMKGQQAAGIIPTAKHFPGHGDTDLDSHGVLPQIDAPFELLWERELVPYRMLAKENLPAVMSGHLSFPQTPAGNTPASLSSWFLQDILRDTIGFEGIVITDDLMMNGATMSAGSLSLATKQALSAGNDVVMLSSTPFLNDPVWTRLSNAMQSEPAFRERVYDAARRILMLKVRFLKGAHAVPLIPQPERIKAELPDKKGNEFFLGLAARSVTLIKAEPETFPLIPERAGTVLLAGQYEDFFRAGQAAYPNAAVYWYSSQGVEDLIQSALSADTVIFCLSSEAGISYLNALKKTRARIIVLSVLTPVYLDEVSWVTTALAVYSYAPESFRAGFSALVGTIPTPGILPFPLNEPRHQKSP